MEVVAASHPFSCGQETRDCWVVSVLGLQVLCPGQEQGKQTQGAVSLWEGVAFPPGRNAAP